MARSSSARVLARNLLGNHRNHTLPSKSTRTLISTPTTSSLLKLFQTPSPRSIRNSTHSTKCKPFYSLQHRRHVSSDSSTISSFPRNMVNIWERKELERALKETEDECLPAVFYYSKHRCPAGLKEASPLLRKLREQFPHVTIYKVICSSSRILNSYRKCLNLKIKSLGPLVDELKVGGSPTFHFYQNGKKVDQVWGPKTDQLIDKFGKLYKYVIPVEAAPLITTSSDKRKRKLGTPQFLIQAKKTEDGKGVVGGWEPGEADSFSEWRGATSLAEWSGSAKLLERVEADHSSGDVRVPSLQKVMRHVESLPEGYYKDAVWWFAKGLFIAQPEKRVIFLKVAKNYKTSWLLDEMTAE